MTYRVALDTAEKAKEGADETAIVTWGKCLEGEERNRYYFTDAKLGHLDSKAIAREAIRQYIGIGTPQHPQCELMTLESKTSDGYTALGEIIMDMARTENVQVTLRLMTPQTYGDKRQRAMMVSPLGKEGRFYVPANPNPDQKRVIDQMVMFTGENTRNLPAIDDGHDACVWDLISLKDVERHEAISAQVTELANELAAP